MKLYLIQHGHALDKTADPERPLSDAGVADVERVAAFAARAGVRTPAVWHSGKTRARQTAERIARRIAPGVPIEERAGLNPNDDDVSLCKELGRRDNDLAIVGHLPHLGRVAGRLLTGTESRMPVAFQPGGIAALERDETGAWQLRWMLVPSLVS